MWAYAGTDRTMKPKIHRSIAIGQVWSWILDRPSNSPPSAEHFRRRRRPRPALPFSSAAEFPRDTLPPRGRMSAGAPVVSGGGSRQCPMLRRRTRRPETSSKECRMQRHLCRSAPTERAPRIYL